MDAWRPNASKLIVLFFRYRSAPEHLLRAQNSNANHNNEMTQDERNFGTKALRRDGVRCDTKGGRALYGVSGGCARLAKLLILLLYMLQGLLQRTNSTIQYF